MLKLRYGLLGLIVMPASAGELPHHAHAAAATAIAAMNRLIIASSGVRVICRRLGIIARRTMGKTWIF